MIALQHMAGKRVAVFGLGGSGMVSAHALAAGGAEIVCYDDNRERVQAAWDAGVPTGDLRVADFSAFDALVLSPGVPLTHPEPHWTVLRAREARIPIVGDIELFNAERLRRIPGMKLVAITGTNGKSTTTALVGHLLREMGEPVQIGGNIGRPALDLAPENGITVLEVSSFQIDLAPALTPDVGVLLNVSSDHLDRHGTYENYKALKARLVEQAKVSVIGDTTLDTRYIARALAGVPIYGFCASRFTPQPDRGRQGADYTMNQFGADFDAAILADSALEVRTFKEMPLIRDVHVGWRLRELGPIGASQTTRTLGLLPDVASLRGDHNVENVAAALAIILALGLDPAGAVPHLASFPGLPHRIEEVGRDGDVLFINDSKATNLDSTKTALRAFQNIHWIAGGKPKPGGVTELKPERYSIRRAYLIGEAATDFGATLEGKIETRQCGTLDAALDAAATAAQDEGGVVLLSPACASFDQFRSFEERGDTFRTLVQERLKGAA